MAAQRHYGVRLHCINTARMIYFALLALLALAPSYYGAWQQSATGEGSIPPFHHAFPVHDLNLAKHFYGEVLGLEEGRSSERWQDYSLDGHQIVAHLVSPDYRGADFFNPVDGDEVPVPHYGLAMTVDSFLAFVTRLEQHNIKFIIKPHLRFQGQPGEQWTMFFKDPSGNNLEFKAMTNPANLFVKYHVSGGDKVVPGTLGSKEENGATGVEL